jgi:hypothetical protein
MDIEQQTASNSPYSIDPIAGERLIKALEDDVRDQTKVLISAVEKRSIEWRNQNGGIQFEDRTDEIWSKWLQMTSVPLGYYYQTSYSPHAAKGTTLADEPEDEEFKQADVLWHAFYERKQAIRRAILRYRIDRVVRLGVSMDALYRAMTQSDGLLMDEALKVAESLMEGLE